MALGTREIPRRRVIGCIIVAIGLSALNPHSAQGQDDAFVQQRDLEAERNDSSGFSIAFAADRRVFHPGEPIKLVFTFRRTDISPSAYEHCRGLGLADAVLDHVDGTSDPQADLWNNGITRLECGILGGMIGGVLGSTEPPRIEFPVYLNQAVRFDRPGRYRFYVRSRHRFLSLRSPDSASRLISNILELEILPRDPAWERASAARALNVLRTSSNPIDRALAARALSYLGTVEAVDEMVRMFDRTPPLEDPSDGSGAWDSYWLRGLYGSPDRAYVVRRMQQELDRPERHISPAFVSHLAVLELTRRSQTRPIDARDYDTAVLAHSLRYLAALRGAGSLQKYLEKAFSFTAEREWPIGSYTLAPGFAGFAADVEAAFATLLPDREHIFLNSRRNWTVFRNAAFIPMLRRLAISPGSGPQDIAFRLLYDLSPFEGREIGLRELAKPDSTMAMSGLAVFPDQLLPDLEDGFVRALELAKTADEYARAMDRIERFATRRVLERVRRVYERFRGSRSCALAPAALAYFFRVAPAYARNEVGNVMREVNGDDRCEEGVLPAIAERRTVAGLEEVAVEQLRNENGWIVADAARMLREHGSASAEAALWNAFERWHERWKDHAPTLEAHRQDPAGMPGEEAVELDLARALTHGTRWVTLRTSAQRLEALCVTRMCHEQVAQAFTDASTSASIRVYPSTMPRGEPSFLVDGAAVMNFSSRTALYHWVSLHPHGTTFTWREGGWFDYDDIWLPGELNSLFEEARSALERRGIRLIRRR